MAMNDTDKVAGERPDPLDEAQLRDAIATERQHARDLAIVACVGIGASVLVGFATSAPTWVGLAGAVVVLAAFGFVLRTRTLPAGMRRVSHATTIAKDVAPGFDVLAAIHDPTFVVNAQRRVIFVSRKVDGLVSPEGRERPLSTAVREPVLIAAIERVLRGGAGEEFDVTVPVPVERRYVVHVEPIGGVEPFAVVQVRDLTAQRAVERMRADFVANASHELRTPLASLSGFIETLRGHARNDEEARDRFLEIMLAQAQRMRRLIDDLLSLSRVELNEHLAPDNECDLVSVAADVLDTLAPQIASAAVAVRRDFPAQPVIVAGDRDELVQVIQNLLDNAIRYGGDGGTVGIAIATAQDKASLCVSDAGPGIAREHLPRLTERFYRVNAKESRDRGGTGLGLAIVKHIISRHRGTILVESELGKGSSFTISLPLAVVRRA